MALNSSKFWSRIILSRQDDGASYCLRAGERVEELVAVAPADGALQTHDVLVQTLKNLEYRDVLPKALPVITGVRGWY